MEEATELFALMDAMLQARPPRPRPAPRMAEAATPTRPPPVVAPPSRGPSEDWLLLGLLALGAGAGLFAATAKRMTSGPPAADKTASRGARSTPSGR
jgi:hypothetical protein